MALLTRLNQVKFKPFENDLPTLHEYQASVRKDLDLPRYFVHGEYTSSSLTLIAKVIGYPKSRSGGRIAKGSGSWLFSTESVEMQKRSPIELGRKVDTNDLRYWEVDKPAGQIWIYENWAYSANDPEGLSSEDVRALVNVEANRRRLTLEKAHALQAMTDNLGTRQRRAAIPQVVRVEVWQRDGGRCVECDSQEKLEFDHVIPLAMGGSDTSRNLQLLCETCNRRKGASLG